MAGAKAKIRLHVAASLAEGQVLTPRPDQSHYLTRVMRLKAGDKVLLFNGQDGEWLAELRPGPGREITLFPISQTRPQAKPLDLHLLFAPLKKVRTDMVAEKSAELGVARLCPVMTERSVAERVNPDRLQAQMTEAAEQCGATFVPALEAPVRLTALLGGWDVRRHLIFCDESGLAPAAMPVLSGLARGPSAILVGPEGGFSPGEAALIRALPQTVPVTLGPRILRAETAVIAALTLWQACCGDWR